MDNEGFTFREPLLERSKIVLASEKVKREREQERERERERERKKERQRERDRERKKERKKEREQGCPDSALFSSGDHMMI